MPYVITTSHVPEHEGATGYVISLRAVATLEEARNAANDAVMHGPPPWSAEALAWVDGFPESGGTVTLPDGTVIEVEAIRLQHLAHQVTAEGVREHGSVLAAFNAQASSQGKEKTR